MPDAMPPPPPPNDPPAVEVPTHRSLRPPPGHAYIDWYIATLLVGLWVHGDFTQEMKAVALGALLVIAGLARYLKAFGFTGSVVGLVVGGAAWPVIKAASTLGARGHWMALMLVAMAPALVGCSSAPAIAGAVVDEAHALNDLHDAAVALCPDANHDPRCDTLAARFEALRLSNAALQRQVLGAQ